MYSGRNAVFALCLVLVTGCDAGLADIAGEYAADTAVSATPSEAADEEPVRAEVVTGDPDEGEPYASDPYVMATGGDDGPALEGDMLTITVSFGGGCVTHDFTLVTGAAFMESNPVMLDAYLIHDGHNDPCEAYLTKRIAVDLAPLRALYREAYGEDAGVVVVLFRDGDGNVLDEIRYEFGGG